MKPHSRLAVLVICSSVAALALSALAGCQKTAAQAEPPMPTVGVVDSRRMNVPVVVTPNGTTRALEDVTIRARVRGFDQAPISWKVRPSTRASFCW